VVRGSWLAFGIGFDPENRKRIEAALWGEQAHNCKALRIPAMSVLSDAALEALYGARRSALEQACQRLGGGNNRDALIRFEVE